MYHKTFEFFQEVESLAERYCLGVSKDTVGESVGVIIRMTINKARVEIVMTAKRCTVRDGEGRQESFEKSDSGWYQKSLEYIEELLKVYGN